MQAAAFKIFLFQWANVLGCVFMYLINQVTYRKHLSQIIKEHFKLNTSAFNTLQKYVAENVPFLLSFAVFFQDIEFVSSLSTLREINVSLMSHSYHNDTLSCKNLYCVIVDGILWHTSTFTAKYKLNICQYIKY